MRALRRSIVAVLAAIGLLYVLVTLTPVTRWWAGALMGPWTDSRGEVLIVLAAEDPNVGVIGLGTYWRCVYAVLVWREGGIRTVAVSGPAATAASMRDFLVSQGIPREALVVDQQATSTRENALRLRELLRGVPGRKILLTSDLHMYRAMRVFETAGLEVTPRPFPYGLKFANHWPARWSVFLDLGVETAKIVVYRWRGWI